MESVPEPENADLARWLRQGHGRAAIFIRDHNPAAYRDQLLYACTHDLAYDSQTAEPRGHYLATLIRLTPDPAWYLARVLEALPHSPAFDQLFNIARRWADEPAVKQALYAAFTTRATLDAAIDLIKLDGLSALLRALDLLHRNGPGLQLSEFEWLVSTLQDRDGEDATTRALTLATESSPTLAHYLALQPTPPPPRLPDDAPYSQVAAELTHHTFALTRWGKHATEEDLRQAAADLLEETNEDLLRRRLFIFRNRPFPGPPDRLIHLARHGDWRLSHAAANTLGSMERTSLRPLALELLSTAGRCDLGVELLARDAQPGDYRLIEEALHRPLDDELYHSLGMDVTNFIEAHPSEEAAPSLLRLYEYGPCSFCREDTVRRLVELHHFSAAMREECLYDAESAIRELALNTT